MELSQNTPVSEPGPVKKPNPLWYLVALLILVAIWVVALELWIKPAFLAVPGAAVVRRLGLYLLPPFLVVAAVYLARLAYVERKQRQQEEQVSQARQREEAQRQEEAARQAALLERKRFTLEILSLGVAVEYLRDAEVLEELQSQEGNEPVLSQDPEDYPATMADKEKAYREREAEVMDHTLEWLTDEWAIPTFLAGPSLHNPQMMALLESNLTEALDYGTIQGRKLNVVEAVHDDTPDTLLQKVFDFMDQHPEVPAALLVAEDGMALRDCLRAEDSPELIYDGPRPKDAITESVVAILLGRKDRVEAMRTYIGTDTGQHDFMKPYWEKEQRARSAGAFTTSEWLPKAWSSAMLDDFSKLPVIGRLHRPQFAHFQGGDASRADSIKEAWEAGLLSLEEGGKSEHLFYDHGAVAQGRRLAPLCRAMGALDPDFDVFDQGINLHRRFGDAGAACPFLGMALAAMASYREKGVSTSVFLRREEGASLVLVSPPAETPDSDAGDPEDKHVAA